MISLNSWNGIPKIKYRMLETGSSFLNKVVLQHVNCYLNKYVIVDMVLEKNYFFLGMLVDERTVNCVDKCSIR